MARREGLRGLGSALAVMLLSLLTLTTVSGLSSSAPLGAEDNGDWQRLFCPAQLAPSAPTAWRGGYVPALEVADEPCREAPSYPTSRLVLLRALVPDSGTFRIQSLAMAEALMLSAVLGLGFWLLERLGRWRLAVTGVLLLSAAGPDFSRFFMSLYTEPAGLVGLVAALLGVTAIQLRRADEASSRGLWVSWTLMAGGVLWLAAAKPAYVGGLLILPVAAYMARAHLRKDKGFRTYVLASAALVTALASWVFLHADAWNKAAGLDRVMSYDVALGMVGQELLSRGGSLSQMNLPADLEELTGLTAEGGVPRWPSGDEIASSASWVPVFVENPEATRWEALAFAVRTPPVAAGIAVRVARSMADAELAYIADSPVGRETERSTIQDAFGLPPRLIGTAAGVANGGAGLVLVIVVPGLLAVAYRTGLRRAHRGYQCLGAMALLACGLSVVFAVTAVVGDGYYELPKHLWLSRYLAVVAILSGVVIAADVVRRSLAGRPG